jgi:hypothetical protein
MTALLWLPAVGVEDAAGVWVVLDVPAGSAVVVVGPVARVVGAVVGVVVDTVVVTDAATAVVVVGVVGVVVGVGVDTRVPVYVV